MTMTRVTPHDRDRTMKVLRIVTAAGTPTRPEAAGPAAVPQSLS
ncbi:MAG: hypothetical protein QG608_23 [Actinomycetota bacterium]|nr:hypothetical protein [Actinomycetota bacterium]